MAYVSAFGEEQFGPFFHFFPKFFPGRCLLQPEVAVTHPGPCSVAQRRNAKRRSTNNFRLVVIQRKAARGKYGEFFRKKREPFWPVSCLTPIGACRVKFFPIFLKLSRAGNVRIYAGTMASNKVFWYWSPEITG
jgi:hypothetical protein